LFVDLFLNTGVAKKRGSTF